MTTPKTQQIVINQINNILLKDIINDEDYSYLQYLFEQLNPENRQIMYKKYTDKFDPIKQYTDSIKKTKFSQKKKNLLQLIKNKKEKEKRKSTRKKRKQKKFFYNTELL